MKHYLRIKRIISMLIIFLIISIAVNKLGYFLRPTDTDIAISTIETFHDMPENSFEVIGYGSSHMWRGMNPTELYNRYGIGSYNYGCNWQNINTTLLFLEDSLRSQKPKVVLIETYIVDSYKENQNIDGEIYYTTAIPEFECKQKYLKQAFGDDIERYLSYYMPLCAFHDNWTNINESSFNKNRKDVYDFYKTMGFVSSDAVTKVTIPNVNTFQQAELNEGSLKILDEIMNICNENNIDVIFYTAPYQGEYLYSDAMKSYAKENNAVYFNLFEYIDEIGFDGDTDFSDEGHLNTSGSNKVADFFGEYLKLNYDLTDFRNIESNLWESAKNR